MRGDVYDPHEIELEPTEAAGQAELGDCHVGSCANWSS